MADKPLRILVVGLSWPPETFLARLIRGLIDAKIDVTIASDQRPGNEWLGHPHFHWLHTPSWNGPIWKRLAYLTWGICWQGSCSPLQFRLFSSHIRQIKRRVDRLQAWHRLLPFTSEKPWDVVYFPWNSAAILYQPLFDLGWPVVISCRGAHVNIAPHNPHRSDIRNGLRTTFQQASAVHCVSEAIKHEALQFGLEPANASIIYPAVDPNMFYPVAQPERAGGALRIVTTGSLIWRKGYEYALTAVRNLLDRGIPATFDIIGDGPERQRILYTIYDLNLKNHVRLYGQLPPDDVREVLQHSDVFLLASLSEGVSNAILEAMACGLSVVTTDCGGMREAIDDGVEGFVVPIRDPRAMACMLAKLASEPALRAQMGQAARARVLRQFRLDQQIGQFITVCQTVVEHKRC